LQQISRPISATHMGINLVGVFSVLCVVVMARWGYLSISQPLFYTLLPLTFFFCVAALDPFTTRANRRKSIFRGNSLFRMTVLFRMKARFIPKRQIDRALSKHLTKRNRPIHTKRILYKVYGLWMTLLSILACYALFPEYENDFYNIYFKQLSFLAPFITSLSVLYIGLIDRSLKAPYDALWHAGLFFSGHWSKIDVAILKQYMLGWLVKAFFLPLMFVYMTQNVDILLHTPTTDIISSIPKFVHYFSNLIYFIDVVIIVVGYSLTLKYLDTDIRSTDSTLFGWLITLVCYQPFWGLFGQQYLNYHDGYDWAYWLEESPLIYLWAAIIIALLLVYVSSAIAFGLRFSNLTHRGIITGGPFRWFKHPAYLAKNLSWWFISMPFLAHSDVSTAIKHSLLLCGVNLIYFYRAKTEENHLSADPVYRQYCAYIDQYGLIAKIRSALIDPKIFCRTR